MCEVYTTVCYEERKKEPISMINGKLMVCLISYNLFVKPLAL